VERENAFYKSSPVDEYHLPEMNSEKVFFGVYETLAFNFFLKNLDLVLRSLCWSLQAIYFYNASVVYFLESSLKFFNKKGPTRSIEEHFGLM
jgi:hypothetical protein